MKFDTSASIVRPIRAFRIGTALLRGIISLIGWRPALTMLRSVVPFQTSAAPTHTMPKRVPVDAPDGSAIALSNPEHSPRSAHLSGWPKDLQSPKSPPCKVNKFAHFLSFVAICLLFAAMHQASAQNVRYTAQIPSISSQYATPFLVANTPPNSPLLSLCHHPANALPCTNFATSYTILGVACPNGAQNTPNPQPSACQASGDAQGNVGWWAPPGEYDYTVCIANTTSCFGPYTVTLGGTSTGATLQVNGTPNGSQSLLNLINSNGINPVDDGAGAVEFDLQIQSFASGCFLQGSASGVNGELDCIPGASYNGGFAALQSDFLTPKNGTYCWQGSATGSGCIAAAAAASSPNLTWPTESGVPLVNVTAPLVADGGGNVSCAKCVTVYEAGVQTSNEKIYTNKQALTSGSATHTFGNGFTYTSTSTFGCTCTDQTAANACSAVPASATTVSLLGTSADVLWLSCSGH